MHGTNGVNDWNNFWHIYNKREQKIDNLKTKDTT